jgi:hypothetical protein
MARAQAPGISAADRAILTAISPRLAIRTLRMPACSWHSGTEASGGVLSVGSRQVGGDRRGRRRGDDPVGEHGVDEVGEGVSGERGADQEDG